MFQNNEMFLEITNYENVNNSLAVNPQISRHNKSRNQGVSEKNEVQTEAVTSRYL